MTELENMIILLNTLLEDIEKEIRTQNIPLNRSLNILRVNGADSPSSPLNGIYTTIQVLNEEVSQ